MVKKRSGFTRRAFIQGTIVTGLGLTLNAVACKPALEPKPSQPDNPVKPDPEDEEESLHITGVLLPFDADISLGMEWMVSGRGFAAGDQIIFHPIAGGNQNRLIVDTNRVDDTAVFVVIPEGVSSARYDIYVSRNDKTMRLGSTTFNLVYNANIPDKAGMTVKGTVYAAGTGLAGVVVSDGYEVTTTDADGIYYLPSEKRNKYVFVSMPAHYEVKIDKSLPLFFNRLNRAKNIVEVMDFELKPVDNDDHVVMMLGDMHLANRNQDIAQFQAGFLVDVNKSIQQYQDAGKKVYALTLGDMSWETYWMTNNFALPQYLQEMNKINAPVFNTMGNHDHDPAVVGDWETAGRFRAVIGPNYYSFNIGKVHYVVLDNVEYLNTDNRNYNGTIAAYQLEWLKKDLAMITDKSTPVVVAMHIQLFSNPSLNSGGNETRSLRLTNAQQLINILGAFDTVHIFSGHTHLNYNARYAPSLMEHNIGAVCATWWWTGRLANNQICKDGTPGGYEIWEANGRNLKWTYKTIGQDNDYQFRAYDLNKVHLTKEQYAPAYLGSEWNNYAMEYASPNQNNEVLINVWNYDSEWKVEVSENGVALPVSRVRVRDPLHIISYSAKRLDSNEVPTADFVTTLSAHMFKVKASSPTTALDIKVTDCFGRVYTERMIRPKALTYDMK